MTVQCYDVVVVGGGFFGCATALHLRRRGFERVAVVERESALLQRASYANQARVHNGYHYPRSFLTAYRSRVNLPRFCRDYGFAVRKDFVSLYALAARGSKVMPRQYERFMSDIGARYDRAGPEFTELFDSTRTAAVYVTEEYAFDARRLREFFENELTVASVDVLLSTELVRLQSEGEGVRITVADRSGQGTLYAGRAINCTYAATNHCVAGPTETTALKHETTEIVLVEPPRELTGIGITVMDGPFFSCMPFPAEQCHSLTHVRYTPRDEFVDRNGTTDPVKALDRERHAVSSRAAFMVADAARFVPCMQRARLVRSLFEIKTVLWRNEVDDGRPILLRREASCPNVFSMLGAKLDNIYDVLASLDRLLVPGASPSLAVPEHRPVAC